MKRTFLGMAVLGLVVLMAAGCANVQLPREINIGSGSDVDSQATPAEIPATSSHEEARLELRRAYTRINQLQSDNRRLDRRADEYKEKYEKCKKKYEKLKDKYDD